VLAIKNFFTEVKAEMRKVTWPSRKETLATTWLVVVIVIFVALYLGACDWLLDRLVQYVLR
jgi:preprotein translocase subunit SecE